MVDITLVELHVEDGSFSANLPFSAISRGEEDEQGNDGEAGVEDENGRSGKGLALLGVLIFLIVGTAAVKHLLGDDESDAVLETAGESA
ncbi:MAG: hypothetical protein ACI8TL_002105 [Natronomonas sp.]|jgi:hypothetical protein